MTGECLLFAGHYLWPGPEPSIPDPGLASVGDDDEAGHPASMRCRPGNSRCTSDSGTVAAQHAATRATRHHVRGVTGCLHGGGPVQRSPRSFTDVTTCMPVQSDAYLWDNAIRCVTTMSMDARHCTDTDKRDIFPPCHTVPIICGMDHTTPAPSNNSTRIYHKSLSSVPQPSSNSTPHDFAEDFCYDTPSHPDSRLSCLSPITTSPTLILGTRIRGTPVPLRFFTVIFIFRQLSPIQRIDIPACWFSRTSRTVVASCEEADWGRGGVPAVPEPGRGMSAGGARGGHSPAPDMSHRAENFRLEASHIKVNLIPDINGAVNGSAAGTQYRQNRSAINVGL